MARTFAGEQGGVVTDDPLAQMMLAQGCSKELLTYARHFQPGVVCDAKQKARKKGGFTKREWSRVVILARHRDYCSVQLFNLSIERRHVSQLRLLDHNWYDALISIRNLPSSPHTLYTHTHIHIHIYTYTYTSHFTLTLTLSLSQPPTHNHHHNNHTIKKFTQNQGKPRKTTRRHP